MKTESRLYPPIYLAQITGVSYISGSGKNTILHRNDGSTITGDSSKANHDDYLDIVRTVEGNQPAY
jgi:hypothetical protein